MLGEKLMMLRKKQGYSQQEVAEMLSITRQTVSNWECNQVYPSIDKAMALAKLYKISLDDLMGDAEIISSKLIKDLHVLSFLVGRMCRLECKDVDLLLDCNGLMKIIDVNDDWIKVEYERVMKNAFFKKEKVIKIIDVSDINGFEIVEEKK